MSSNSGESPASAHHDAADAIDDGSSNRAESPESPGYTDAVERPDNVGWNREEEQGDNTEEGQDDSPEDAQQELDDLAAFAPEANGITFATRRRSGAEQDDDQSATELPTRSLAQRPKTPESTSTPDDTPSVQGSMLSSPSGSVPASYSSLRPHRPTSLQPFERRFSARLSPSPSASPRAGSSPKFLSAHSRQSSVSSNLIFQTQPDEVDTPQAPWEVVQWTKLKKISGQVFSEVGKRNFGRPTCLAVAASLVIGTSKGYILVFDYQQVLKSIIGPGTKGMSV